MKTNNIIKTNVDKSTKEGQKLTFNFLTGNHIKLSELEGKELEIKHYMIFEQTETNDETGEVKIKKILVIQTAEGHTAGTNSPSCLTKFESMLEAFGEDLPNIKPTYSTNKSKNGRSYLDFEVC